MKQFILKVKMWLAIRKANHELDRAIVKALDLHKIHNKRYYVIPDTHHRLRVFSWTELKHMKKQGLFSATCKEPDFIRESFYFTPSRIDGDIMTKEIQTKKRKAWHEYYKAYRL